MEVQGLLTRASLSFGSWDALYVALSLTSLEASPQSSLATSCSSQPRNVRALWGVIRGLLLSCRTLPRQPCPYLPKAHEAFSIILQTLVVSVFLLEEEGELFIKEAWAWNRDTMWRCRNPNHKELAEIPLYIRAHLGHDNSRQLYLDIKNQGFNWHTVLFFLSWLMHSEARHKSRERN